MNMKIYFLKLFSYTFLTSASVAVFFFLIHCGFETARVKRVPHSPLFRSIQRKLQRACDAVSSKWQDSQFFTEINYCLA
jgi:hypothetical protein